MEEEGRKVVIVVIFDAKKDSIIFSDWAASCECFGGWCWFFIFVSLWRLFRFHSLFRRWFCHFLLSVIKTSFILRVVVGSSFKVPNLLKSDILELDNCLWASANLILTKKGIFLKAN